MNGPAAHSGPHWRRVMAALANRDARTAFAQIVLGENALADAKEQRRDRALAVLLDAGLVERTGSGAVQASEAIFRDLLSQQPKRQPKTGVDRFLRLGRIDRYPASAAVRRELLAWIVGEAIQPGEDLTERQANERLLNYTEDVAVAPLPCRLRAAEQDRVGVLLFPAGIRTDSAREEKYDENYIETLHFQPRPPA